MASTASISKYALSFVAVWLLFSSQTMKDQSALFKIRIEWNLTANGEYTFEEAVYPQSYNGLPVFSLPLRMVPQDIPELIYTRRKEISQSQSERIKAQFSFGTSFINLKKMTDRGSEVVFLEIIPFQYDSLTDRFYLIEYLELKIPTNSEKAGTSNLRAWGQTENSVLTQGEWFKIPVTENGIHKIDYNFLKNAGINLAATDPKKIQLYGNGGGMLPQKNSDIRTHDLIENNIMVSGEADGIFDKDDYILFYGQGADQIRLNEDGELDYQNNFFSDTSYYFLTLGANDGARITSLENLGTDHPEISTYNDYLLYEKDEHNIIQSGRDWFGQKFENTNTYDFKFDFPGLVPNTVLKVSSAMLGQTYETASLDILINGKNIGQQSINSIVEGSYLAKGSYQIDEFTINTNDIPESDKFTIRMAFHPVSTAAKSQASLDFLKVTALRQLNLFGSQTTFRAVSATDHAISTYKIKGVNANAQIWDITEPLKPKSQKFALAGENAAFGAMSADLHEYIVFNGKDFLKPEKARKIQNQNLHGSGPADLLIVSHAGFLAEAERLADLRRNHDGLSVQVVTCGQIYNEFSSGKQDVTAIRDYIRYSYIKHKKRLQNVLLFGKGSFDYKDRIDRNTNFVPIYSSRNSLHPINSYSSDDYYGFLDDEEGEWEESYSGDHLMDVGVGRLPVKTIEEARIVVDKLVRYATNPETFGPWRNELFFIADDGDGNLHQRDAEKLATLVDTAYTQFNVNKLYLDAYPQVPTSTDKTAPELNADIDRYVEKGGLIFNFTGHGSTTRWTHETILNISSVLALKNKNRLPLFVTATCEFGQHDNPAVVSGAEYLLLNPHGGAIGLLTTSRPVFSSTNYILNKAFYQNVFEKENGQYRTLGEVFRRTKNQSLNGSSNRNFSLLADPSMVLAAAPKEVVLVGDETSFQPGDTLNVLSKVKLKGKVLDANGVLNTGFNGSAITTVYDRARTVETLGDEDSPMHFMARDNLIFKGEASVKEGEFDLEFIVPNNISYDFDQAKISVYALDAVNKTDASGSTIDFVVGGPGEEYPNDQTPPQIELFVNDTSFVSGGIAGSDMMLLARLSDESGIRISYSEEGDNLMAILDNESEVTLNAYYTGAKDSYRQGWVTYPYKNLSIGKHAIRLIAWDIHGNVNEAEIEFYVTENKNLAIDKLINYPNPFSDLTRFSFGHNRAGDDLEISIAVYTLQGKLVNRFYRISENSPSRITDLDWNGRDSKGAKLASGLYLFQLSLRSLSDGSKNQANQKLVIIN